MVSFRAQFGQSQSFSSLSHKNLIMNMEPLVPALPSTNEYDEAAAAAADSSKMTRLSLVVWYTLPHTARPPVTGLWKVTLGLPCVPAVHGQHLVVAN